MGDLFENQFYTEDFDQEVLNFIEGKYGTESSGGEWSCSAERLYYGTGVDGFWTDSDGGGLEEFEELSNQEFKQKIGMEENMTTKQFTKSDLVAGKHVFKVRKGGYYLVIKTEDRGLAGVNLDGLSHFGTLDTFKEDLSYRHCSVKDDLDIVEVFVIDSSTTFDYLHRNLKCIWKREEKSEAQIQFEKLQQQITELQAQADKLKATL